jgi:hypothetical protein
MAPRRQGLTAEESRKRDLLPRRAATPKTSRLTPRRLMFLRDQPRRRGTSVRRLRHSPKVNSRSPPPSPGNWLNPLQSAGYPGAAPSPAGPKAVRLLWDARPCRRGGKPAPPPSGEGHGPHSPDPPPKGVPVPAFRLYPVGGKGGSPRRRKRGPAEFKGCRQ